MGQTLGINKEKQAGGRESLETLGAGSARGQPHQGRAWAGQAAALGPWIWPAQGYSQRSSSSSRQGPLLSLRPLRLSARVTGATQWVYYPQQPELEPPPCADEETEAGCGTHKARISTSSVFPVWCFSRPSPGSVTLCPCPSTWPPPTPCLSCSFPLTPAPPLTPGPGPIGPGPQLPWPCTGGVLECLASAGLSSPGGVRAHGSSQEASGPLETLVTPPGTRPLIRCFHVHLPPLTSPCSMSDP